MFRRKRTCFVFLSRHQLWIVQQKHLVQAETFEAGVKAQDVIRNCLQWEVQRLVLLLEPPWIFVNFDRTIPLSRRDTRQYAERMLTFRGLGEQQIVKVGAGFLELPIRNQRGLLCGGLPPQTQALVESLEQQHRMEVQCVPLFYACVPELLQQESDMMWFYGLEQFAFVEKQGRVLERLIPLPNHLSMSTYERIISDTIRSLPGKLPTFRLGDISQASFAKERPVSITKVASHWRGLGRNPYRGFWWGTENWSWELSGKVAVVAGCISLLIGFYYWYDSTTQHIQQRQQQLEAALQQLQEDEIQIDRLAAYQRQQERFAQVNTVYQQLQGASWATHHLLSQLIHPLPPQVWIKHFSYEAQRLDLMLLTLHSPQIPHVLEILGKIPAVQSVHLRSQESLQIQKQQVTEFILAIELNPNQLKSL